MAETRGRTIELVGGEDAERALLALAASLADLRPFWPLVVPLFVGWMRRQFETEGDFGGDPWEPLSLEYAAWKERKHPGKGILYATGDLRKAASLPKREVTPSSLTLIVDDSGYTHGRGAPRAVAGFHQDGTGRMPARPIIFESFPAEAERELEAAAEGYIRDVCRRVGLLTA